MSSYRHNIVRFGLVCHDNWRIRNVVTAAALAVVLTCCSSPSSQTTGPVSDSAQSLCQRALGSKALNLTTLT
jgi:hypothetical protein